MKVSEYVSELLKLEQEYGDLEVETFFVDGSRRIAHKPKLSFRLILSKRESKPRFWNTYYSIDKKGDAVIEI